MSKSIGRKPTGHTTRFHSRTFHSESRWKKFHYYNHAQHVCWFSIIAICGSRELAPKAWREAREEIEGRWWRYLNRSPHPCLDLILGSQNHRHKTFNTFSTFCYSIVLTIEFHVSAVAMFWSCGRCCRCAVALFYWASSCVRCPMNTMSVCNLLIRDFGTSLCLLMTSTN